MSYALGEALTATKDDLGPVPFVPLQISDPNPARSIGQTGEDPDEYPPVGTLMSAANAEFIWGRLGAHVPIDFFAPAPFGFGGQGSPFRLITWDGS